MSFRSLLLVTLSAGIAFAGAPTANPDFSVGATIPISSNRHTIKGWKLHGNPQILSDRLILTPPTSGNVHAGLWASSPLPYEDWSVELNFRTSGSQRPGGSLTLWYASREQDVERVYDSRGWDGLAIVVDSLESGQGSVRAYLNDGTKDYAATPRSQSLAFAHCEFGYRNRGVISKVLAKYERNVIKVEVDGKDCFEVDKTKLPKNYYLGVTAATEDPPDSFELFSVLTYPGTSAPPVIPHPRDTHPDSNPASRDRIDEKVIGSNKDKDQIPKNKNNIRGYENHLPSDSNPPGWEFKLEEGEEEKPATAYRTQEEQFADLHDRLLGITHHIATVQYQIHMTWEKVDGMTKKQEELIKEIQDLKTHGTGGAGFSKEYEAIKTQFQSLELLVIEVANAVTHKDYSHYFDKLHMEIQRQHSNIVTGIHGTVKDVVTTHRPKIGFAIGSVLVVQVALVIAYVIYKRRRHGSPKKYL